MSPTSWNWMTVLIWLFLDPLRSGASDSVLYKFNRLAREEREDFKYYHCAGQAGLLVGYMSLRYTYKHCVFICLVESCQKTVLEVWQLGWLGALPTKHQHSRTLSKTILENTPWPDICTETCERVIRVKWEFSLPGSSHRDLTLEVAC